MESAGRTRFFAVRHSPRKNRATRLPYSLAGRRGLCRRWLCRRLEVVRTHLHPLSRTIGSAVYGAPNFGAPNLGHHQGEYRWADALPNHLAIPTTASTVSAATMGADIPPGLEWVERQWRFRIRRLR